MPPELWTLRQVISTFNAAFIKSKGKWVAIVAKIKVALLVKDTPNLFFWIIICIFVLPAGCPSGGDSFVASGNAFVRWHTGMQS